MKLVGEAAKLLLPKTENWEKRCGSFFLCSVTFQRLVVHISNTTVVTTFPLAVALTRHGHPPLGGSARAAAPCEHGTQEGKSTNVPCRVLSLNLPKMAGCVWRGVTGVQSRKSVELHWLSSPSCFPAFWHVQIQAPRRRCNSACRTAPAVSLLPPTTVGPQTPHNRFQLF